MGAEDSSKKAADSRLTKLLRMGMGAFWMTEQSLRKTMLDLRLTKEATQYLVEQIERRKNDVFELVQKEIQRAIDRLDVQAFTKDLLAEHEIHITARIRLHRKGSDTAHFERVVRHSARAKSGK